MKANGRSIKYLAPASWHDTKRASNDRAWLQAVGFKIAPDGAESEIVVFRPYATDGGIDHYVAASIQMAYEAGAEVYEMGGNMCSGVFLTPAPCLELADIVGQTESDRRSETGEV